MKRFIVTILLFVLPLGICLVFLEYEMRSIPNTYSYKNHWLNEHISSVHIWILGSSHSLYGLSPKEFSKPAFNSAHVAQTLLYDEFIFEKFIDHADSLEWVILPISYFTMPWSLDTGIEWWRGKNYYLYYDCPYFKNQIRYHYEILGNPLPFYKQVMRVWKYIAYNKNDINCDSLGYAENSNEKHDNWLETGKNAMKVHTKDISVSSSAIQINQNALNNILEKCQQKYISVLIITTPTHQSYYNLY